jgi:hypothetical protein
MYATLLRLALVATMFASLQVEAQHAQLMVTGHFIGPGPWARVGGPWLALEQDSSESMLREVTVRSTPETPVCGDVGYFVSADATDAGTFLMRGIAALRPGPIKTFVAARRYVAPSQTLQLGDDGWVLYGEGTVKPAVNAGRGETRTTLYRLLLKDATRKAVVFSMPAIDNDGPPDVVWVGDLDGDNVPDILADVRSHYVGHNYKLFLSSAARPGQLLGEVAALETLGC